LRKIKLESQLSRIKDLSSVAGKNQASKTRETALLGLSTFRLTAVFSIFGVLLGISTAMIITRGIAGSIARLRQATRRVSKGLYEDLPTVNSKDELGDLSSAFNRMAKRLAEVEDIHIDSSPLTRLPGGVAIENNLKKRIEKDESFAFCMMDLDNFKPFNDRYGYTRGNDVIKNTGRIIEKCAREMGTGSDFIGHVGGDDFALITSPEKFKEICEKVIEEFDSQIPNFYNSSDRENGYIVSKTRQGRKLKFPIMTISIAAVDNTKSHVENHIVVGEIIADLKKYAKSFAASKFVVDRRGGKKRTGDKGKNA
jgi:diguanylate cyclase (GGDEF)-like protein